MRESDRKEVSHIILTSDHVVTIVEEVKCIDVSAIQEPAKGRKAYSRCIVVFTHKGETYKFWFEADKQEKLALKTYPGDDWSLRPKRYEGSKKWGKK